MKKLLLLLLFIVSFVAGQAQSIAPRTHISQLFPYTKKVYFRPTASQTSDTCYVTPVYGTTSVIIDSLAGGDTIVVMMRDTMQGVVKNVLRNVYFGDQIRIQVNIIDSGYIVVSSPYIQLSSDTLCDQGDVANVAAGFSLTRTYNGWFDGYTFPVHNYDVIWCRP